MSKAFYRILISTATRGNSMVILCGIPLVPAIYCFQKIITCGDDFLKKATQTQRVFCLASRNKHLSQSGLSGIIFQTAKGFPSSGNDWK
jgi:hypothetical protein